MEVTAKEAVEFIESHGGGVYIDLRGGGMCDATPESFQLFVDDPDQFRANNYGVTKECFRTWMEWHESDEPCLAETKTGKPCRMGGRGCNGPQDFIRGVSDRCIVHGPRKVRK